MFAVSARHRRGHPEFRRALFDLVPQPDEPSAAESEELADFLVYRPRARRERAFRIFRTDRGFRVTGTPPETSELEEALRAAGARPGAEIEVGDETFELA